MKKKFSVGSLSRWNYQQTSATARWSHRKYCFRLASRMHTDWKSEVKVINSRFCARSSLHTDNHESHIRTQPHGTNRAGYSIPWRAWISISSFRFFPSFLFARWPKMNSSCSQRWIVEEKNSPILLEAKATENVFFPWICVLDCT